MGGVPTRGRCPDAWAAPTRGWFDAWVPPRRVGGASHAWAAPVARRDRAGAHQRRYLHAAHLWRADETRRNVDYLPPSLKVAVVSRRAKNPILQDAFSLRAPWRAFPNAHKVLHLEKGLLSRLPFVHGTPRPFAAALVSVLVPLLANIDEVVVARGEVADALFFVVQGGVSVLASSHAVR